jgi:hypothetical protein
MKRNETMTGHATAQLWSKSTKITATALIAGLAVAAYYIGSTGLVAVDASQPFRPIAFTVIVPVALFFTAYALSSRLRDFVLAQDLRTLTMLQHWRVLGFTFLALYVHDTLPALFTWPAGFGDILIGVTAPFVVARLGHDPAFATSRRFVGFHVLGLFDFVVAVVAATLASGAFPAIVAGSLTSAPMEVWPLNLFPSFFVPLFIIAHVVVLLKVRALRREAGSHAGAALQAA